MFGKEDNTYNELREKSINQWLDEMSCHEDITVRSGVGVTEGYISDLKKKMHSFLLTIINCQLSVI